MRSAWLRCSRPSRRFLRWWEVSLGILEGSTSSQVPAAELTGFSDLPLTLDSDSGSSHRTDADPEDCWPTGDRGQREDRGISQSEQDYGEERKTGSDLFRPVQTRSDQYRTVQTGLNQFRPVCTSTDQSKPVEISPNQSRQDQISPDRSGPVQTSPVQSRTVRSVQTS